MGSPVPSARSKASRCRASPASTSPAPRESLAELRQRVNSTEGISQGICVGEGLLRERHPARGVPVDEDPVHVRERRRRPDLDDRRLETRDQPIRSLRLRVGGVPVSCLEPCHAEALADRRFRLDRLTVRERGPEQLDREAHMPERIPVPAEGSGQRLDVPARPDVARPLERRLEIVTLLSEGVDHLARARAVEPARDARGEPDAPVEVSAVDRVRIVDVVEPLGRELLHRLEQAVALARPRLVVRDE